MIGRKIPGGRSFYSTFSVGRELNKLAADGRRSVLQAPSNRLVYFDAQSFHRGAAATERGWRWFGRITLGAVKKPANEVRKQVQVYLTDPSIGW